MARVDEFLQLVDDPSRPALDPGNPADDALLSLLTHVAFSDGRVDDAELAFLERVLPDRDPEALRDWAMAAGALPLDGAALARALPTPEERWKGLRFAVRMAWKDGRLAREEHALLASVVAALELPATALERALGEVSGRGAESIDPARLIEAFEAIHLDAVDWSAGPLLGDLLAVVPSGATPVLRIGLDGIEFVGLYKEGIAGRFREAPRWVPWRDVVTYTRVTTLGAAVRLHTEDGGVWTLADFRLSGLGTLLDRLWSVGPQKRSAAPKIEQVRGE